MSNEQSIECDYVFKIYRFWLLYITTCIKTVEFVENKTLLPKIPKKQLLKLHAALLNAEDLFVI